MNWLVKEEPENYSYSQFAADRTTVWAGVRNPVAQRNLREMKKGDRVFFYHTGKEKAIDRHGHRLEDGVSGSEGQPTTWSSSSSPPARR